jgi:hypothetical protein
MTMIIPLARLKQHSSRMTGLRPSMSIAGHHNSTPPFTSILPNVKHYRLPRIGRYYCSPIETGCLKPASAGLRGTVYAYASVAPTDTVALVEECHVGSTSTRSQP